MWFRIKLYIQYLLKSTNQHGVHSPFVYHLVTKCLYTKTYKEKFSRYLQIKNYLLKSKQTISIKDYGKGSTIFKSNERKVSDIVKIAGLTTKKAKTLIKLISYFQPKNVLEIGTSVGLSAATMSISNNKSAITTLEGCPETSLVANNLFSTFKLKNIKLIEGKFEETLPNISNKHFDFIYIDGNHQQQATLDYFEQCLHKIHNNSFIIFDDINWSKEMFETWKKIKKYPNVTVTIDLYFWGIVFFRNEQAKQDFTIRI